MPAFFRMSLDRTEESFFQNVRFHQSPWLLVRGFVFFTKDDGFIHGTCNTQVECPVSCSASFQIWTQIFNLACVSSSGRELMSAWPKQANYFNRPVSCTTGHLPKRGFPRQVTYMYTRQFSHEGFLRFGFSELEKPKWQKKLNGRM